MNPRIPTPVRRAFTLAAALAAALTLSGCATPRAGTPAMGMQAKPMQDHPAAHCSPDMQARMAEMHKKHSATGKAGMGPHPGCPAAASQGESHQH